MPVNILLRFSWVITLVETPIHADVLAFILALFEALRRIQWNTFRLENEVIAYNLYIYVFIYILNVN